MSSTSATPLCHYHYDPLDRLVDQRRPNMPVHQRFYCKSRLANEIQGVIHHSIMQHDEQLLAQQQRQDGVTTTTLLATDLQRSVLQLLKTNPRIPIAYSPYGHHPSASGLQSLMGFNGERPDSVTGHYLLGNGYRAFNPVLMRFNSPDSLSPFGKGGLNSYGYCLGDPINRTDSDGHISLSGISKLLQYGKLKTHNNHKKTTQNPSIATTNQKQDIEHLQSQIVRAKRKQDVWRDLAIAADARLHSSMLRNVPSNQAELLKSLTLRKVFNSEAREYRYANLKAISKHQPDSPFIRDFTNYFNEVAQKFSIPLIDSKEIVRGIDKYYSAAKDIREKTLKKYKNELDTFYNN
jgi:RHS repeat-associated protein